MLPRVYDVLLFKNKFFIITGKERIYAEGYYNENRKITELRILGTKIHFKDDDFDLILGNAKTVFIPNNEEVDLKHLHDLGLPSIRRIDYCTQCLRIKPPFYSFNDNYVCGVCAERIINKRTSNTFLQKFIFKKLKSIKNLNKVLSLLDNSEDLNYENTFYNKIPKKEYNSKLNIKELKLPLKLINLLPKDLTEVQELSINKGLLEGKNLLIVSPTGTGKTLVAELPGIKQALKGRKFFYLTPTVSLANQKFMDFKEKYKKLGLGFGIRVGVSKINVEDELIIQDSSVDRDVIIGTYESIDLLLRTHESLGRPGVFVIDEIQMLNDPERGPVLAGLISRLKYFLPKSQFIFLSATIGNPKELSRFLKSDLVQVNSRNVSIENHIVVVPGFKQKKPVIKKLVERSFNEFSSYGFKGQSIVFTNSRLQASKLADYLDGKCYHSGLTYAQRLKIEKEFLNQEIPCVVTTSALAAGVDFPARQVVFETMRMGREELSISEFEQMSGRAGRRKYHDKGLVFLVLSVSEKLSHLLKKTENVNLNFSIDSLRTELMNSIISLDLKEKDIPYFWKKSLFFKHSIPELSSELNHDLMNALVVSFFSYEDFLLIKLNIDKNIMDILIELIKFKNYYLSDRLHSALESFLRKNLSAGLFNDFILEILFRRKLDISSAVYERIENLKKDFFNCKCITRPYCDCAERKILKEILNLRIKGLSPKEINKRFKSDYDLEIYPGDIFKLFDEAVHKLKGINNVLKVLGFKKEIKKLLSGILG